MFSKNKLSLDERLKRAGNEAIAMEKQDYKSIIHANNDTDEMKYSIPEQTPKVTEVIGTPIEDNIIQAQNYNSGEYIPEESNELEEETVIENHTEETNDYNYDYNSKIQELNTQDNSNNITNEEETFNITDETEDVEENIDEDIVDEDIEELEDNFTIEEEITQDITEELKNNIVDNQGINNQNIIDTNNQEENVLLENDNEIKNETTFENISTQEIPNKTQENIQTITVKSISNIINILDLFRTYEEKTQTICKQFLDVDSNCNDTTIDINAIILYNILNIDNTKKVGLNDLVKLKEEERTSRAFSLIALDNTRLIPLKELVEMFNPEYTNTFDISDKINYCKELESGIDSLNNNSLLHLKPINELLQLTE